MIVLQRAGTFWLVLVALLRAFGRRFSRGFVAGPVAVACSASPPPLQVNPPTLVKDRSALQSPDSKAVVTEVEPGTVGPFLAIGAEGALMLWAEPAGRDFSWMVRSLDDHGKPFGSPQRIAAAPPDLNLVQLRPVAGGFVGLATSGPEGETQIQVLGLGAGGAVTILPQKLSDTPHPVLWLEVVETRAGALALWAEQVGPVAQLYGAALSPTGAVQTRHTRLFADAVAWQALAVDGRAQIAVVTGAGGLDLITVDGEAQVLRTQSIVERGAVGRDVDLALHRQGVMVAYSQPAPKDRNLFSVLASAEGQLLTRPRLMVAPDGDQELVRLLSDESRRFALWRSAGAVETLWLARIGPDGRVSKAARGLELPKARPSEFALAPNGLAVALSSCAAGTAFCEGTEPLALTFDNTLTLKSSRSVAVGAKTPNQVWGLRCGERCMGLAATFGKRVEVRAFPVPVDGPLRRAPLTASPSTQAHLRRASTLANSDTLSDLDAVEVPGGTLLAWVTDFDPSVPYRKTRQLAPDGRRAPVRALLKTLWLSEQAQTDPTVSLPEPEVLSYRARSVAGVELRRGHNGQLLVWSALDRRVPEVFGTLLDDQGRRQHQRMLTRKGRGEISALAAAPWRKGWLVAWVDARRGSPHTYIAKFGPKLRRLSSDTLLGPADATRTPLDLRVKQGVAELLLSQGGEKAGPLQLHRVHIDRWKVLDAVPLAGPEVGAVAPHFVDGLDGASWVASGRRWLQALDVEGAEPAVLGPATPTALSRLRCDVQDCYWAQLARQPQSRLVMQTAPRTGGPSSAVGRPGQLLLAGTPPPELPPVWVGEALWFADVAPLSGSPAAIDSCVQKAGAPCEGTPGKVRIRRAEVEWRRRRPAPEAPPKPAAADSTPAAP